jgi:hypothetical protein
LIARYNCYLHYTEVLCLWVLCFVYSKCSKCTNLIISLFQMCHHVMHLFGNKRYMCIFIFVGWSLEVINLVRIGSFLCWSGLVSFRLIWLVWLVSSIWLFSLWLLSLLLVALLSRLVLLSKDFSLLNASLWLFSLFGCCFSIWWLLSSDALLFVDLLLLSWLVWLFSSLVNFFWFNFSSNWLLFLLVIPLFYCCFFLW